MSKPIIQQLVKKRIDFEFFFQINFYTKNNNEMYEMIEMKNIKI